MGYRLEWRLLGRGNRLLDAGEIDGDFADRRSARAALKGLLLAFPEWGRVEAEDYWWARRSADADLEIRFALRTPTPALAERAPQVWSDPNVLGRAPLHM
jgi:hypothetical protein